MRIVNRRQPSGEDYYPFPNTPQSDGRYWHFAEVPAKALDDRLPFHSGLYVPSPGRWIEQRGVVVFRAIDAR